MRMRSISDETRSAVRIASPYVASGHATATSLLVFVLRET